jgi:hypothetical protein
MDMYGGGGGVGLASALDRGESPASCSGPFFKGKHPQYQLNSRISHLRAAVDTFMVKKYHPCRGLKPCYPARSLSRY